MKNLSPAVTKIIYLIAIGILIIPLSLVALPETRDGNGNIKNQGGKLSVLRNENHLSQANLSEIDPASETMKLASLGLRGIAVSTLWMQAMDHKEKEEYDQLASTLKALTKIQPNFIKVWEFQAHNLAYNVSMEFDDYEYRYYWVKKGIGFLKDGVPYNKTDHRVTDSLGFFTGNKMGKSDEKVSFRRMFRQDDEFHQEMSDFIDPESYETLGYGHDSWKMAYQWYDYSRDLVDQGNPKRTNDMMFYMHRPAQLRNQGLSLQTEYRTQEKIQDVWRSASEEWREYGEEQLTNSFGTTYTMEGMARNEKLLETYRQQLDDLAPGVRDELIEEMTSNLTIPAETLEAWELPADQRTDHQTALAREFNRALNESDEKLDAKIAAKAKPSDSFEARRLALEIDAIKEKLITINRDSGTINFEFWKSRTGAEASSAGVAARDALYDAEEMKRRSIYDDEFDRDYKTKEITITKKGAISLYLTSFERWHELFNQFPELKKGPLSDDLGVIIDEFYGMLDTVNRGWPTDFPLQNLIDERAQQGENDKAPTTEELEEQESWLSGRSGKNPTLEGLIPPPTVDEPDQDQSEQDQSEQEQSEQDQSPTDDPEEN